MANLVAENEMFFNQFQPQMKNRFIMYIDGVPSYICKRATFPKVTQESKEIPHINLVRNTKGRSKWGTFEVTLYNPIAPNAAQAVIEWIRLGHESVTGRDGYDDFYKKDIIINALGPVGDKVSEWICKGCFITEANFGEGDWASDDLSEVTLTIQPDLCILNY